MSMSAGHRAGQGRVADSVQNAPSWPAALGPDSARQGPTLSPPSLQHPILPQATHTHRQKDTYLATYLPAW